MLSKVATLALFPVDDPSAFGVVVTDGSGRITQFVEKPSRDIIKTLGKSYINAGIYVLEPEVLDLIEPGEVTSFEYDVFPKLLNLGMPFFGYQMSQNYWRDIGSPQSYLAAHMDCLAGIVAMEDSSPSSNSTENSGAMISEDCFIGSDTQITNSVIGPGVHVEPNAHIESSVIWSNTRISAMSRIDSSVVGDGCHVGKHIHLTNVVLGEKTFLADYSRFTGPSQDGRDEICT